jgi:hypothetical protein
LVQRDFTLRNSGNPWKNHGKTVDKTWKDRENFQEHLPILVIPFNKSTGTTVYVK